REVRKLIKDPRGCSLPDRELLDRFSRQRDDVAFGELVRRHSTLVLGVCRRILNQAQDAEDAFQATFLLLAQKAHSLGKQESISSWLYIVAQRVASKARVAAARRQRRESRVPVRDLLETRDEVSWREVRDVLDGELGGLPERYRAP